VNAEQIEARLRQIARDIEKCDIAIALYGENLLTQPYVDQRSACYAELGRLNKLQGLDTGQTDTELLAELEA